MFLTTEELQELTHGVRREPMIKWLRAEGFQFRVAIDGYPVVLREHVRAMLGVAPPIAKKSEPDFTWMKKRREAEALVKKPSKSKHNI